jgi:hypothetical protein
MGNSDGGEGSQRRDLVIPAPDPSPIRKNLSRRFLVDSAGGTIVPPFNHPAASFARGSHFFGLGEG